MIINPAIVTQTIGGRDLFQSTFAPMIEACDLIPKAEYRLASKLFTTVTPLGGVGEPQATTRNAAVTAATTGRKACVPFPVFFLCRTRVVRGRKKTPSYRVIRGVGN